MKKILCLTSTLFLSLVAFAQLPAKDANGCFITGPGQPPDYFGCYPNYATSPILQKFMAPLPGIPIAHADTITYPGSDYYEIALQEFSQKMHPQLPATKLRGYVQINNGTDANNQNTIVPAPIQYLGPIIVALRDRPVRVKFVNQLPTAGAGDLFIPTDTTYMGAGMAPGGGTYTQNRATLHLHGGTTPWISDGTPHQWITPATENTPYPKGVSVQNVPDMPNAGCDGANSGCQTFFYSNQQSARLMFYHDHAYGITRLNVYVGEAAGYVLTDAIEQDLINGTNNSGANTGMLQLLPGVGIPLVIQDKTFVPDTTTTYTNLIGTFGSQLAAQDPTWDTVKWGGTGSLWFPHVYMPNQNTGDLSGANPMGRWDYGPWFWPPFAGLLYGPVTNPYFDPNCVSSSTTYCEAPQIPGTPESMASAGGINGPSGVPESFMDTPIINGMAYPTLDVPAGVVRFRVLNAANDRFWNLSLWVAADKTSPTTSGTTGTVLCNGGVAVADCTEVKMVPFNSVQHSAQAFPSWWYDSTVPNPFDDRVGGVPDPATRGPAMIQIGTEGGFLPAPAVIRNQPVNYVMNKRDITVGNVREHALFLGPAERADVLVDFSSFAGKTLILYSDAPAPVPAADPRIDYFTGAPDQSDVGGAPSTQPGFGPNTRTLMQIRVGGSGGPGTVDDLNPTLLGQLQNVLPKAFQASLETIIVPQAPYNAAYGGNFPGGASAYAKIGDTSFSFTPINSPTAVTANLEPKSIIEDFQMDYGRMNALLGLEIPRTNNTNQTSIPQSYVDPPSEVIGFSQGKFLGTNLGQLTDGTQLWKVTHNGVDTHAMHFHMFNVQIVNRVGWDGAIKPPEANELGWKDTIRTNPLEDIIVALRPIQLTNVPFPLPNSKRPLDVTDAADQPLKGFNIDPTGAPITALNRLTNFGWEYVWHCHLLGHEENDMMRGMALAVPPELPSNLSAAAAGADVNLSFTDNSLSEASFTIQRAAPSDPTFANPTILTVLPAQNGYGSPVSYVDTGASSTPYFYRVFATGETVGSNATDAAFQNYPRMTPVSGFSNVAQLQAAVASASPTSVQFGNQTVTVTSAPRSIQLSNIGSMDLTFTYGTTGDFTVSSTTCTGTLTVGSAPCTLDVTFTPTAAGTRTGALTINSNASNSVLTVPLTGTGVAVITASATVSPAPNNAGWVNTSPATVAITGAPNGGPSVASITYSASGAQSIAQTTVNGSATNVPITQQGITTVTFFATDAIGDSTVPQSITVKLDTGAPTLAFAPPANAAGWNCCSGAFSITGIDAVSGVASITYSTTGATTIAQTTANGATASLTLLQGTTTVTFFATDVAGNVSAPQSVTVRLDLTPPTITANSNPPSAKAKRGSVTVTVSGTVADALSGVVLSSGTYRVTNGTVIGTGTFGISANGGYSFKVSLSTNTPFNYNITVSAKDKAGNTGSAVTTFAVR